MGVTIERWDQYEPIVLAKICGHLTLDLYKQLEVENLRFVETIGEPIYVIVDINEMETTLADILKIIHEATHNGVYHTNNQNIKMIVFVGTSQFIGMYRSALQKRQVEMDIAMFNDINVALDAVRLQVEINQ